MGEIDIYILGSTLEDRDFLNERLKGPGMSAIPETEGLLTVNME